MLQEPERLYIDSFSFSIRDPVDCPEELPKRAVPGALRYVRRTGTMWIYSGSCWEPQDRYAAWKQGSR
jgi:hypothetical protein